MNSGADNKAVSARYYEAWNTRSETIPHEIFAPEFFIHDPASPVPLVQGPGGVVNRIRLYHDAFPDLRIEVHRVLCEEDIVATRWTLRGTHRGTFGRHAPTGRRIEVTGTTLHRVAGGRIVEAWVNWDTMTLWQQLGLISFRPVAGS
jgi:steroid delta-isomerase-like uncharacterized protein